MPGSKLDPGKNTGEIRRAMPDDQYYFDLVVFKVENTIFRVPKNAFIVPGTIFESMFSLPSGAGKDVEGLNDQNPITLPVNEDNFRGFLRAIYPINGFQIETNDWLSALELSTMWMFDAIRRQAIEALDEWVDLQNAKEIILLAKKFRVLKWLKDGYTRLLLQPNLTVSELCADPALDWETIAKLLSAKLLSSTQYRTGSYGYLQAYNPQMDIVTAMEQTFLEEFSGMYDD